MTVKRDGPTPKRSDERRRRNKVEVDSAPLHASVKRGPGCPRDITGLARRWYESLRTSGQSEFYTDSDWTSAQIVAVAVGRFEERPSAHMLTAILSGFGALAATEGDRRRLRIELARAVEEADPDEAAAVASLDAYRRAVSGGS